ncbi:SDR family oxidoreductase [candidate division CSSED10-310 bacterium]|uniref:dTDP-4-dehydrorhamnose reductase n=1 Tax=candidate division CSSED10-310 bacterium TaxID=2855610 RepID=A0ABV6YS87_UNCC1
MKYLILGANGLIGKQFVRLCQEKEIEQVGTCFSRSTPGLFRFNQLEFDKIQTVFQSLSPTVVVNCIGLAGGVQFCQDNPELGRKYHVEATQNMVDWCRKTGAVFVFFSTDYVFDGQNPPYKEEDPTNPLNVYGKLKQEAEAYIRQNLDRCVIVRTTNVFGWDSHSQTPNFLMAVMNSLKEKNSAKVPAFLYGNPTYVGDLAAGIWDLIENKYYGLYHLVGTENINRYDWAKKLVEVAGLRGKTIEKIDSPPDNMVPRPLRSHLRTEKFSSMSRVKLHNVVEGLKLFVSDMNSERLS